MSNPQLTVRKPRLRQGRSYALKTSMLERVLAEVSVECPVYLHYWEPQRGGTILQAQFQPPNPLWPHDHLFISAGHVPSAERSHAVALLQAEGLSTFTAWLRTVLALPQNSPQRHARPFFDATYEGGALRIRSTPRNLPR